MSNEKRRPFVVYSFKMMRYLDRLGFKFFDCRPNNREENKVVFFYDRDPDLIEAAEKFLDSYSL